MPAGGKPHLTVVIPAFNEQERLGRSLPRIAAYLRDHRIEAEVLVVDDGSTDATRSRADELLRGMRGRVLHNEERMGKGHAIRSAVLQASGRWVLLTDADLSTPIEEHSTLAAAVREHDLDIAIGSRGLPESKVEVRQTWLRQTLGRLFNLWVRAMTRLPFRDTQCGFKLFDRARTRPLFEKMVVDGFAFDVELLFLSMRFGLSVREIPVIWRNDPRTSVGLLRAPPRMILDVLRVRWRFRRGRYNPDIDG